MDFEAEYQKLLQKKIKAGGFNAGYTEGKGFRSYDTNQTDFGILGIRSYSQYKNQFAGNLYNVKDKTNEATFEIIFSDSSGNIGDTTQVSTNGSYIIFDNTQVTNETTQATDGTTQATDGTIQATGGTTQTVYDPQESLPFAIAQP